MILNTNYDPNQIRTLWIGEIEIWMDEFYLANIFNNPCKYI